jgi:hypothetical protein
MKYYVEYNAKLMGVYKSLKSAINLIYRKGWKNDELNSLYLFDNEGDYYNPTTGEKLNEIIL